MISFFWKSIKALDDELKILEGESKDGPKPAAGAAGAPQQAGTV